MALRSQFDTEKAIEAIVYVASQTESANLYNVLKVLYFADKLHLERFGRQILGDRYIAMEHGPVPSDSFDLVKTARGDARYPIHAEQVCAAFAVQRGGQHLITPLREVDEDVFSASDLHCLDEAVAQYGNLPFGQLKELSHDEAYHRASRDGEMALEDIARTLADGDALVEHLRERLG